jgi:hypothetical protein
MLFLSALIMMICNDSFYRHHTRRCNWETFEGHKEFLDKFEENEISSGRG